MKSNKRKVVKLNINYIKFIKELVSKKIALSSSNRKKIEKMYLDTTKLKFSNLPRVSGRVNRKEVRPLLVERLKILNLPESKFKEADVKIVDYQKDKETTYATT